MMTKHSFMKQLVLCICCCFCVLVLRAQNTDSLYRQPLREVLRDVEQKFGVTIRYADSMVKDKWVNYAAWRFRPNLEATLDNVLKPLDMKVKHDKGNIYKLSYYEYYRWDVAEGWAELDRLAAQYKNVEEWELRKKSVKPCLLEAMQLSPLPPSPQSAPITTPVRKFDGYTVQNIALEILPGVYINGSLYKPAKYKGKIPVILNPDGHWEKQRYRADCQYRCATLAKMGAMAFSYDLFAWGESLLQFDLPDHRRSLSMTIQGLGSIRILDYLLAQDDADKQRVGIAGGSGGGSHSVLVTAIDERITLSVPVVSVSSYFYGGCPCESGMPVHDCGGRTNNVELAAMAAPRPQLLISDGADWTDKMPEHDFPYLQSIYGYYGKKGQVENVHLPLEKHDFGINKRLAVYDFIGRHFKLDSNAIKTKGGKVDESFVTIEPETALYVFGDKGERLPATAIHGYDQLVKLFAQLRTK